MLEIWRAYVSFITHIQAFVLTLILLLTVAAAVAFSQSLLRLRFLRTLYRSAKSGAGAASLEETLARQAEEIHLLTERVISLENELALVKARNRRHFQRWMLERYRAFRDVGGDQSFSLALLDEDGDGLVLTSIYGRDESRIFAKRIERGRPNHPLSEEERRVLAEAMRDSSVEKQEISAVPANL